MRFWNKFRGNAVAWAAASAYALAAGLTIYRYLKSQQNSQDTSAVPHVSSPGTSTVSLQTTHDRKRKVVAEDKAQQSRANKRSRSGLAHAAKPKANARQKSASADGRSIHAHKPTRRSSSFSSSAPSTPRSTSNASSHKTSIQSESEDDGTRFQAVCEGIDIDALEKVAVWVRKQKLCDEFGHRKAELISDGMSCTFEQSPMCGSYNIVYPLIFSDDVKWLVRIPGHGHIMQGLDKVKMDSEYQTMRYIKANTCIPLPEIFYWDLEANEIGSAFALIEHLAGRPLSHVWQDVLNQRQRYRSLKGIANMMAQLQFGHFEQIGMLRFDEQGSPIGVESEVDLANEFAADSPWTGDTKELGPYASLQEKVEESWYEGEDLPESGDPEERILQMALDSIPLDLLPEACNSLNMPDLDLQNVLVDDCGNVTGIIDWDGAGTCPTAAGCGRYPNWLRTDWGPWYDYDPEDLDSPHMDPSPEEMIKYRRYYAANFARCSRGVQEYDPRMTHVSHLLWAIQSAIKHRFGRPQVVEHLLNRAFGVQCPPDATLDAIKGAFAKMWHAEWEQPEPNYDTDVE